MSSCARCGAEFEPRPKWQRFCSQACRASTMGSHPCAVASCSRIAFGRRVCEVHRRRRKIGIADDYRKLPCPIGASCKVVYATCRCGELYVWRRKRFHCEPFRSKSGQTVYVSTYRPVAALTLSCVDCGATVPPRSRQRRAARCEPCEAEHRHATARDAKHKRDARERGARVETVYRRKVYERDGWRCQLCGGRVRVGAQVPDPLAPTLDHIVPLAAGGEHSYLNVQTAHFRCNTRKSHTGVGQLRWIA